MASNMSFRLKTKKNSFQGDIAYMMESLGFDEALPETLQTLEDITVNYLIDIFNETLKSAEVHGRNRIKLEDLKFAVRKDPRKLNRIDEIFTNLKIIATNRKGFDSKSYVKKLGVDGVPASTSSTGKVGKVGKKRGKYKKRKKKTLEDAHVTAGSRSLQEAQETKM